MEVGKVVKEVGYKVPYVETQGIKRHLVGRGCCFDRRNLGDFFNQGCMCLSMGCFVDVG